MTGKDLPDEDHVVRYVRPNLIDNGVVSGVAFCLRENETGLSVFWLEVECRSVFAKTDRNMN